jgi:hypothetical protein
VDGYRRYADEPEPGWYTGQGQYAQPAPDPYDSGVHERPSGAFRLPEQRETDYVTPSPYVTPDPVTSTGSHGRGDADTSQEQARIPVRGPEYPTIRPTSGSSLADAPPSTTYGGGSSAPASAAPASAAPSHDEPTGLVPPVNRYAPEPRVSDAVYRTKRPLSALLVLLGTIALMVPVVMLLIRVTFVDDLAAGGVVPAVLLTLGLPLTGMGLHALAGGGAVGREAWLRPPLAYLPVGLFLLIAAGLGVG